MILTGLEIQRQIEASRIVCEPFKWRHINPNSVDLTLDRKLLRYKNEIIDPRVEAETEELVIPSSGLCLPALSFWLGSSVEVVGSNHYVPLVHAKSSTA